MKTYNFIYRTINNVNGKSYIGKHSTDRLDDGYIGSGILLAKAINKYGKNNFSREIIELCENDNELNEREKFWIEKYDCVNSNDYYNISFGGEGGDHLNHAGKTGHEIYGDAFDSIQAKRSNTLTKYWESNENRLKHSSKLKSLMTEELKLKISNSSKAVWEKPDHYNKMKLLMTDVNRRIEKRIKSGVKCKMKWDEPGYREKMKLARLNGTPRNSKSQGLKLKELWQDKEWREQMLESRRIKRETKLNS